MTRQELLKTGAGEPEPNDLRCRLIEAVVTELMDYFSVPAVSGLKLFESDARWIAAGIVRRTFPDPEEKTGAPEIEISPEMIDAGIEALSRCDLVFDSSGQIVACVFLAMVSADVDRQKVAE